MILFTNRLTTLYSFAVALVVSTAALAQSPPQTLSDEKRVERNYQLAKKMYDAYVNIAKLGYPDAWEASDFASERVDGNFGISGPYSDEKRRWNYKIITKPEDFKEYDRAEYAGLLKMFPDLQVVAPFKAFCNPQGCAFQLCVGGHDKDGKYYEFDEAVFMWTNEYGKIYQTEVFDDYVNMPDFLTRVTGLPLKDFTGKAYFESLKKAEQGAR
jgi:hypothetical protein